MRFIWMYMLVLFTFAKNLNFVIILKLLFQVNPESQAHGGELVAETLKAHGVEFIFTLTGGHISPILVAAEKIGIRIVDTRHEVTTVFAADAVARLSGKCVDCITKLCDVCLFVNVLHKYVLL